MVRRAIVASSGTHALMAPETVCSSGWRLPTASFIYGGGSLRWKERKGRWRHLYGWLEDYTGEKTLVLLPHLYWAAASAARTRNSEASVAILRIGKREGLQPLGLHLRDPAKARSFSPQRRHSNPIILTISTVAFRACLHWVSRQSTLLGWPFRPR